VFPAWKGPTSAMHRGPWALVPPFPFAAAIDASLWRRTAGLTRPIPVTPVCHRLRGLWRWQEAMCGQSDFRGLSFSSARTNSSDQHGRALAHPVAATWNEPRARKYPSRDVQNGLSGREMKVHHRALVEVDGVNMRAIPAGDANQFLAIFEHLR